MQTFNRIYSWSVFVPSQSAWVHLRRSEMHGPGWWFSEARSQSGAVLGTRVISAEYAQDLFNRYGKDSEIQYYS
jgi:hypothetical protein